VSIAADLLGPALDMIQAQGQAVTLSRSGAVKPGSNGALVPVADATYSGYAVFGETGRRMFRETGRRIFRDAGNVSGREVSAHREVAYLAAKNFTATPRVGDALYRASTAAGVPMRVEAVEAIAPNATTVLWRLELAR